MDIVMTTTVRRKIPRLICASCLTTGLLVSAGATTAVAASQSPSEVSAAAPATGSEPKPGDGGDDWGGGGGDDWGGGGGDDWGGGGGDDWPGGGGGGHDDDGWPQKGHDDDGGPDTGGGTHDGGGPDTGGGTHDGGGPDTGGGTVKQPDKASGGTTDQGTCEAAGNVWAQTEDGGFSCFPFGKIQGNQDPPEDVPTVKVSPAVAVQALKCIGAIVIPGNVTGTLGAVYKVSSAIEKGENYFKASQNGDIVDMVWEAGGAIPGPIGTTFTCTKIVKVMIDEQGNPYSGRT
ncbi:hypothetical protein [Streptomyces sp. NPDC005498]|uniref:hypothetical protein n=1 Tax=Streptomyces sp. NPDC005498 TaxID=3364717 RepID=UPI0036981E6D